MLLACLSGRVFQIQGALAAWGSTAACLTSQPAALRLPFPALAPAADVVGTDRSLQRRMGQVMVVMGVVMRCMMGVGPRSTHLLLLVAASGCNAAPSAVWWWSRAVQGLMVVISMVMLVMVAAGTTPTACTVVLDRRWRGRGRGGGGLDWTTFGPYPTARRLVLQDVQFQALLASPAAAHQHTVLGGDGVDAGGLQSALHGLLLIFLCWKAPFEGEALRLGRKGDRWGRRLEQGQLLFYYSGFLFVLTALDGGARREVLAILGANCVTWCLWIRTNQCITQKMS